jgi:transcription elongation factor GreA
MDEVHLSGEARQRLEEELDWRSDVHRKEISAWLERAREHGDIRENADYDAAKNEQGHNESRIRQIKDMLKRAVHVENASGEVVAPGTVVEVKMEGDDETTSYLVGSIEERHDTYDVLSTGSPLGQALLGHSPGEVVTYDAPRRTLQVEVVSVRPAG